MATHVPSNTAQGIPDGDKREIAKLEKDGKFSEHFKKDVDMSKVNFDVIKPWIYDKVVKYMGFEDDIIIEYVHAQLTFEKIEAHQKVNPKQFQLNLTPFLGKHTPVSN